MQWSAGGPEAIGGPRKGSRARTKAVARGKNKGAILEVHSAAGRQVIGAEGKAGHAPHGAKAVGDTSHNLRDTPEITET